MFVHDLHLVILRSTAEKLKDACEAFSHVVSSHEEGHLMMLLARGHRLMFSGVSVFWLAKIELLF